ncbi:MAG: zinc ribbon domain-containing protein [Elusimicrobiota bacterium]
MIQCPKCSAENDDEALFCDQCGTAISPDALGGALDQPCPACGGEVRETQSVLAVCQACGLNLGEHPASGCQECAPAAAEHGPAPAPEEVEKWPCPVCAMENPQGAAQCSDCGIVFKKSPRLRPCPRCSAEVSGDTCNCGAILTLDKLMEYVDPSVQSVCSVCKQLYSVKKDSCPDCGGELEPAEDLKNHKRGRY